MAARSNRQELDKGPSRSPTKMTPVATGVVPAAIGVHPPCGRASVRPFGLAPVGAGAIPVRSALVGQSACSPEARICTSLRRGRTAWYAALARTPLRIAPATSGADAAWRRPAVQPGGNRDVPRCCPEAATPRCSESESESGSEGEGEDEGGLGGGQDQS